VKRKSPPPVSTLAGLAWLCQPLPIRKNVKLWEKNVVMKQTDSLDKLPEEIFSKILKCDNETENVLLCFEWILNTKK
jgi:hypothetical protein